MLGSDTVDLLVSTRCPVGPRVPGLRASHGQEHDVAGKRPADHPAVGAKLLDDAVVERLTGLGVVHELFCVDFPHPAIDVGAAKSIPMAPATAARATAARRSSRDARRWLQSSGS